MSRESERPVRFESLSGIPVEPLYTPESLGADWSYADKLGQPGEYPFTRGVYPTMYRGRLWTMRMFAGFGRPEDTNERFKYLLAQGQTGLSTAFDMPALMGYDADHPRARGEVGKEGVSISTLDDFERLFADIPLGDVTTSMTINCTASVALAMYLAIADKQGVAWDRLGGTMQNDMLKEFIAQKEWICPPEPAVRIVTDMIEFTSKHVPRFNPVSISGYHIREAGSTAVQELAFTLADGLGYVEAALARGLDVDSFAPRLSFFFDIHNDFFEEIAKLRAARRIWARFMKERYHAKKPESMRLRTHTQTAGVSATAQQPLNNVARVALQALAAVLGGAQSLHTNSYDETWALPTEEAVTVALRTQQIIAEETGVPLTVDPLGGSYYLEKLTDQMEAGALEYIARIDAMGGMVRAIDEGYPQQEIADAAYRYQLMDDRGEKVTVGVNKYVMKEGQPINYLRIDESGRARADRAGGALQGLARPGQGGAPAQAAGRGVRSGQQRHAGADRRRQGLREPGRDRRRLSPSIWPLSGADHLLIASGRECETGTYATKRAKGRVMSEPIRIVKTTHEEGQAQGQGPGVRQRLHGPHVRGELRGRERLVRPARRALRSVPARPGHRGAALRPVPVRGAQGLPRPRREDPAVPAAEARGAAQPDGPADDHPGHRSRSDLEVVDDAGRRGPRLGARRRWAPRSTSAPPSSPASRSWACVRPSSISTT